MFRSVTEICFVNNARETLLLYIQRHRMIGMNCESHTFTSCHALSQIISTVKIKAKTDQISKITKKKLACNFGERRYFLSSFYSTFFAIRDNPELAINQATNHARKESCSYQTQIS